MKKGAVEYLLQYVAIFLFSFTVFYITASWLGSGHSIYQSMEESSLIYAITSSSNALSGMENGYVRKEMMNNYDITIGQKLRDGRKTGFYVKVKRTEVATGGVSIKDVDRACGRGSAPSISADGQNIHFQGKIETPDPCYKLSAELKKEGNNIDVLIYTEKAVQGECDLQCKGFVEYSGSVANLAKGTYNVRIIKSYKFKQFDQRDETLGSKDGVEVKYDEPMQDETDDETKEYFFMTDVEPAKLTGVNCLKIIKEPGELVRFEVCTRSLFASRTEPGRMDTGTEEQMNWYKTQVWGGTGECGPTSAAMTIGWATGRNVDPRDVRDLIGYKKEYFGTGNDGATSYEELMNALARFGVKAEIKKVSESGDLVQMLKGGSIVILSQDMSKITQNKNWKTNRIGKQHDYAGGHYIILKGLDPEDKPEYFVVYDPLSGLNDKYDNGDYAGKDRLYPMEEVWNALGGKGSIIRIDR